MNDAPQLPDAGEPGDSRSAADLLPLVYDELRRLAGAKLADEKAGQTLQPTALVHEAFLRLGGEQRFHGRNHFFAAAAEAMRRILVEAARRKGREKRGGGLKREYPNLDEIHADDLDADILPLHEALEHFTAHDPLKAKLVELRFFGGLTLEQAAAVLNISLSTAERGWRYARAWLYANMADTQPKTTSHV